MSNTNRTDRRWQKTRWQGVYQRAGRYRGQLYLGKIDGRSRYEWLDEQRTGKAAADALAAARAGRSPRRRGSRHTVASWAKTSAQHPHGLWLALRPRAKASSNQTYAEQAAPFVDAYGDLLLSDLDGDVELALEWIEVKGMRWTLGGVRAMCTDARRAGHITSNPFLGLGISTGPGRKHIDILTTGQVDELAVTAERTWRRGGYGKLWRAFVYWQAYVGPRPAEGYGLIRPDIDFKAGEVVIARQRPPEDARTPITGLPLPKNGLTRRVNAHPLALEAVRGLPTPLRADAPLFHAKRGGALSGASQHYYWHPIRCAFGNPGLDLYELRHFCGSYHLNDLELAPQDVAEQLGHTDGGVLVQRLYGHPSQELARKRIAAAYGQPRPVELASVPGEGLTRDSQEG
jgi:integrase